MSLTAERYAQVEPLTTARALKGPFDYRLPAGMQDDVAVGSLLLVPFSRRRVLGVVTGLSSETEVPAEKLAEPIEALGAGVPAPLVELGLWVADQYCSTSARGLALVTAPGVGTGSISSARARDKSERYVMITEAGLAAAKGGTRLSELQAAVLELPEIAGERGSSVASVKLATGADLQALKRLASRGLVEIAERVVRRRPENVSVGAVQATRPRLNDDQAVALSRIEGALAAAAPAQFLLHGVTGSGKTEVYLGAVETVLRAGRGAIVMVPEIALTSQTVARFTARFGDEVAVLHSKLTPGQRHDEWMRLRLGEARVCVGPRSAVFAPVRQLGLIVVDEEHDPSYKQDGDPRYDAREVAAKRSELEGAVLVHGSATPRVESWHNLPRLSMPQRVDSQSLPVVELLDMRNESAALHRETGAALAAVARRGEKAIVLLNRRGWSNYISCRSCGHVWQCPDCDVTLVFHRADGSIACHHCGHREPMPGSCAKCGSLSVDRHGSGTERLAAELSEIFGGVTGGGGVDDIRQFEVFRLDTDAARSAGDIASVLSRFERCRSGVLVGTQMVAKGHDFPDVTLAVVLDADASLRFPDFRAEERTFALVAQLAGRCGRSAAGGRVLVQTTTPEARSLLFAAHHDTAGFIDDELARREVFGYPPYSHVIRVVCSDEDPARAMTTAAAIGDLLRAQHEDLRVLGPVPLFRLKGRERAQLEIRAAARELVVPGLRLAVDEVARGKTGRGVSISVDVDAQ